MADWRSLQRHPLSAEYADMTGPEFYGFCLDLKATGFLPDRPIVLHEGMIIDGWQRKRACMDTAIEPEFTTLAEGIDPEAYVRAVNDRRRHESKEDRQARQERVEKRRSRVAESRVEGKSIRTIAEEEKVSTNTVLKDIEKLGVAGETPDGKVIGKDGRKQSSTKPKVLCRHCEHRKQMARPLIEDCPDCAALRKVLTPPKSKPKAKIEPEENGKPITDDAGVIVPIRLIPVFKSLEAFKEAERLLNATSKAFKVIEEGPCKDVKPVAGSQHYRKFFPTFKSARERLKAMRPSLICPDCEGEGCRNCGEAKNAEQDIDGKGWLTVEEAALKTSST